MKNRFKNVFAILGVLFVAIIVTSLLRPWLNEMVFNLYSQHSTSGYLPSYVIRGLPLTSVFALAGFTFTIIIDSTRRMTWTIFAVLLGAILSPLFYYNAVAAPVPIRREFEMYLHLAVPGIGLAFGAIIGLTLHKPTSGSSPTR